MDDITPNKMARAIETTLIMPQYQEHTRSVIRQYLEFLLRFVKTNLNHELVTTHHFI